MARMVSIVVSIISMLCLVGFFLSLHDIYNDYVSPQIITAPLSGWTRCPLEWGITSVCFWTMVLCNGAALVYFLITANNNRSTPSDY